MTKRKWPEPGCCGPTLSVISLSSSDSFTISSPSLFDSSNFSSMLVMLPFILPPLYLEVFPKRRNICPVFWQQEPLVSWVTFKVYAQHFIAFPFVIFHTLEDVN